MREMVMRKTWIRLVAGYALTAGVFGAAAGADMILTLEPKDLDLNPISGGVPPGTRILVDIFVSVDAEGDTGLVINTFDLVFDASSDTIVVDSFSFLADMSAYFFQSTNLGSVGAFSPQCDTASCIELTQQPSPLGRVEVIVNGPGELNVAGFIGIGGGAQSVFNAVDPTNTVSSVRFWLSGDNLQGGILSLSVTDGTTPPPAGPAPGGGGSPVDTDGDSIPDELDPDDDNDGVPDVEDDFPLDPNETVDSDADGIGDNADPDDDNDGVADADDADPLDPTVTDGDTDDTGAGGSRVSGGLPCGIGMVPPSIFIFLGLSGMGRARRRSNRRSAA